ncbi:MAG: hypothetical protein ACK5IJ_00800 [Mangrovibacterium sp.]
MHLHNSFGIPNYLGMHLHNSRDAPQQLGKHEICCFKRLKNCLSGMF